MITVISGTNRKGSKTRIFAAYCAAQLKIKTEETIQFIALEDIPHDWFFADMYSPTKQAKSLAALQDETILPAQKFLILSPEYNGGMPGALKLFIDAVSVREYAANFKGKKAALIGISSGRSGNIRGCDQGANVLSHVGVQVMPNKLPISQIEGLLEGDVITDKGTLETLDQYLEAFLAF